jgi:hypothetical protein
MSFRSKYLVKNTNKRNRRRGKTKHPAAWEEGKKEGSKG